MFSVFFRWKEYKNKRKLKNNNFVEKKQELAKKICKRLFGSIKKYVKKRVLNKKTGEIIRKHQMHKIYNR